MKMHISKVFKFYLIIGACAFLLMYSIPSWATIITVDPDDYAQYTVLDTAISGITLSVQGSGLDPGDVAQVLSYYGDFGCRVTYSGGLTLTTDTWHDEAYLKVAFDAGTNWISFDFDNPYPSETYVDPSVGILNAYDISDNLIASVEGLGTVAISSTTEIAYFTAWATDPWPTHVSLERFSYESAPVPEPATMLLLGTGLIGLAAFGRKKLFKRG